VGVKDKFICSQTSLKFKKIYSHVDHVYPLTFDSIMSEFVEVNKIDFNKIKLTEDVGTSEVQKILDNDINTTRRQVEIIQDNSLRQSNNIFLLKTILTYLALILIPLLIFREQH
jgi:hypothetical protein